MLLSDGTSALVEIEEKRYSIWRANRVGQTWVGYEGAPHIIVPALQDTGRSLTCNVDCSIIVYTLAMY